MPEFTSPAGDIPRIGPWDPVHHVDSRGRRYAKPPPVDRFFRRVVENETGCWIWTGARHPHGYGHFKVAGAVMVAHRWAYELMRCEIPADLQIDHLCHVRECVNPWHLEPVPARVNVLRGWSPSAVTYRTGLCPRGHDMTDAYQTGGRRACRKCRRVSQAKYDERRRSK